MATTTTLNIEHFWAKEVPGDRDLADYILHFRPTQAEVIPYYANLLCQDGVHWGELNAAIISRWSLTGLKRIKREAWRTLQ